MSRGEVGPHVRLAAALRVSPQSAELEFAVVRGDLSLAGRLTGHGPDGVLETFRQSLQGGTR
jgi:hypothetical protein